MLRVVYLQDTNDKWCSYRMDDDDVAYIRKDIFHDCELEIVGLRQDSALLMTESAQLRELKAENIILRNRCAEKISADLVVKNDKLEIENAELRAEVRKNIPAMKDAAKVIAKLRAELAAIKPDWKDTLEPRPEET